MIIFTEKDKENVDILLIHQRKSNYVCGIYRVADPYYFFTDPDPGFFKSTDPDPDPLRTNIRLEILSLLFMKKFYRMLSIEVECLTYILPNI